MTKNDHYAALNVRFDLRAGYLKNKGFKVERIEEYDVSVFVKRQPGRKIQTVVNSYVMNADDIVWADKCDEIERSL